MRIKHSTTIICLFILTIGTINSQEADTTKYNLLDEVIIKERPNAGISRISGAENGHKIGQDELFRAACCNLGESFVSNPTVDVIYNDAAIGARQIKLLGLSGTYVQMLTENLQMSSGALQPYLLSYIPGAWMESISISKGSANVKNGPQSITGQINVEYLKPDDDPSIQFNIYGDSRLKVEANSMVNTHINNHLSTELLGHYEHDIVHHDENQDNWHDSPNIRQLHIENRWKYTNGRYIMHTGVGYLQESRDGGQLLKIENPFRVQIDNQCINAYTKHAYLLNREHNTNLALTSTIYHFDLNGVFGNSTYRTIDEKQIGINSQIMLEHEFNENHQLSTGLSLNIENANETLLMLDDKGSREWHETNYGAYAQYTYTPSYYLTAMLGLRADQSSLNGFYLTPRMHIKWVVSDLLTLRGSTGIGHRSVRPLAENHYILASGRHIEIAPDIAMNNQMSIQEQLLSQPTLETAINTGFSSTFYIPVGSNSLTVNAEYYYTKFTQQLVVNYDSDPNAIILCNLHGLSYSHTAQIDATYEPTDDWNILLAMRYNKVMCTYGNTLLEKPLQSRYKGLISISWRPMMSIWHVDVTLSLNGGGRMPQSYVREDGTQSWPDMFPAYPQINMQLTREFRHFKIYIGIENLTNYQQPVPVVDANNPWSTTFEPTMIWGPVHGIMSYWGIRMNI